MLPISTIFAATWLSVYHLTWVPSKIGINDSIENYMAANSLQVELLNVSVWFQSLWHDCSLSNWTSAPQPVALASEYAKTCGFLSKKQFLEFNNCKFSLQKNTSSLLYSSSSKATSQYWALAACRHGTVSSHYSGYVTYHWTGWHDLSSQRS